jgi:transcriptional regulator with XRE-family HTH domain
MAGRKSKGGELAKIRLDHGLTQTAVAQSIGVHPSALSRIEDGSTDPAYSRLRLMRAAYGVAWDPFMAAVEAVRRRARKNGRSA